MNPILLRTTLFLTAAALLASCAEDPSMPAPAPLCPAGGQCFTVTRTVDAGPGSLRQAILDANARPGLDRILFAIPGAGPHTIVTGGHRVTDPIHIDGYSQRGSLEATTHAAARLGVVLEASGPSGDGLVIATDDSVVEGLALVGFGGSGDGTTSAAIRLTGTGNVVRGCHLGIGAAAAAARGNQVGVAMHGLRNVLGGTRPQDRNVIVASRAFGVDVSDCRSCRVLGNHIGTTLGATSGLGNDVGVRLGGAAACGWAAAKRQGGT